LREPNYEPTLAEIAERCRQIQSTWSAEEEQRRAGCYRNPPATFPVVRTPNAGKPPE
jgi:hypothetical protein